jgi:hypothetical protein
MTDEQLLRYSRHVLLDDIGVEGQQRLLASHALVIGAGGLGSPVALYLGTAGVGRITLVDHDTVDLTNLQRQIAHDRSRVGQPKAESAAHTVRRHQPRRAGAAVARAPTTPCWTSWCRGRRGAGLQRQLPPARPSMPPACGTAPAGVGRGHRLRRPGVGVRHAAGRRALLRLPVSARGHVRGGALRHDGGVCAAGGHHRHPCRRPRR